MHASTIRVPADPALFRAMLEGLTLTNMELIQRGRIPPIYAAGVRYAREPRDVWRTAPEVLRRGSGDCEDLSAWRAAELRASGEDPGARVDVYRSGPRRLHAVVRRGDGSFEDPSRRLGMNAKPPIAQYCDRIPMRRARSGAELGAAPDPAPEVHQVTFDVYKSGQGWSGIVRLPMRDGRALFARTPATTSKPAAAKSAVAITRSLARSPLIQAALPPQAALALRLARSPAAGALVRAIARR